MLLFGLVEEEVAENTCAWVDPAVVAPVAAALPPPPTSAGIEKSEMRGDEDALLPLPPDCFFFLDGSSSSSITFEDGTPPFKLEMLLLPVLRCTPRMVGCGTRVLVDVDVKEALLLSVDDGFCDLLDLLSVAEVSPFGDALFRWRLWLWLK